jgi:hypothetical protein
MDKKELKIQLLLSVSLRIITLMISFFLCKDLDNNNFNTFDKIIAGVFLFLSLESFYFIITFIIFAFSNKKIILFTYFFDLLGSKIIKHDYWGKLYVYEYKEVLYFNKVYFLYYKEIADFNLETYNKNYNIEGISSLIKSKLDLEAQINKMYNDRNK